MSDRGSNTRIIVGITGASGSRYGLRLVEEILRAGARVTVLVSKAGRDVLKFEAGLDLVEEASKSLGILRERFGAGENLSHYAIDDLFAPPASGSSRYSGMVICPCSMGTIGRIAAGQAGNLLERAADVMLKERRPLVVVPRETPLGIIHLENLLALARAGGRVLPAAPGFYHRPETIDDLVEFVVARILDQLNIDGAHLLSPWGEPQQ